MRKSNLVQDTLLKGNMGKIKTKFLLKQLKKRSKKWQKVHSSIHLGAVIEMAREEKLTEAKLRDKWETYGNSPDDEKQLGPAGVTCLRKQGVKPDVPR